MFAGSWRMIVRQHRCDITLTAKSVPRGYGLTQKCSDAFALQSAAAWKPFPGGIVFVSETGAPILTFDESEDGLYVSSNDPELMLRYEGDRHGR